MRELFFGALAVAGVGGAVYYSPGAGETVYGLSHEQAMSKLEGNKHNLEALPLGPNQISVTRDGHNVLKFYEGGSFSQAFCTVQFEGAGEGRVFAKTWCGDPSDNAIADGGRQVMLITFNEYVHATLSDRPIDKQKIELATQASVIKNVPAMREQAKATAAQFEAMESQIEEGESGW